MQWHWFKCSDSTDSLLTELLLTDCWLIAWRLKPLDKLEPNYAQRLWLLELLSEPKGTLIGKKAVEYWKSSECVVRIFESWWVIISKYGFDASKIAKFTLQDYCCLLFSKSVLCHWRCWPGILRKLSPGPIIGLFKYSYQAPVPGDHSETSSRELL